ncbi:MAG: hypothetical protein WCL51_02295 [Bacteroidota bacterium]
MTFLRIEDGKASIVQRSIPIGSIAQHDIAICIENSADTIIVLFNCTFAPVNFKNIKVMYAVILDING